MGVGCEGGERGRREGGSVGREGEEGGGCEWGVGERREPCPTPLLASARTPRLASVCPPASSARRPGPPPPAPLLRTLHFMSKIAPASEFDPIPPSLGKEGWNDRFLS